MKPKKFSEGFPQLAGDFRRATEVLHRLFETNGEVRWFVLGVF
ncbi:MAG: hypothetical protein AB7E26_13495 [Chryseobacterium sp.]